MTNMICCKTCRHCKYIRTPQITGHDIDYVCERKGSIIDDITYVLHGWGIKEGWCVFGIKEGGADETDN